MHKQLFFKQVKTILFLSVTSLVGACGGNASFSTQSTSKLPETIDIKLVSSADLATPLIFNSSAVTQTGLKFVWNFGDGSNSTEPAPKHTYAKAGDYEVSLVVSDKAGKSKEVKSTITINNLAGVRGLVCSGSNDTGWCWQAPRPSGNHTNSIAFANANTGWHVGGSGEIFKTIDAGKTWSRQASGVSADLYEVKFFDDKIGWILGSNRTLLNTTDGGLTWKISVGPIPAGSQAVGWDGHMTLISASSLMLETSTNKYFTVDSGQTWLGPEISATTNTTLGKIYGISGSSLRKSTALDSYPREVLALKDQAGVKLAQARVAVAGENVLIVRGRMPDLVVDGKTQYGKAWAWRSEDAGANWTTFTVSGLPPGSENSKLFSLDKEGKVWLTQYETSTYRTEDGGTNWSEQFGHPSAYGGDEPAGLNDLRILGSRVFARFDYYRAYQVSDDLGKTWTNLHYPDAFNVNSLSAHLRVTGELLTLHNYGLTGGTYISADKGDTWVQVFVRPERPFDLSHSVAFANAKHGVSINSQSQMQVSNDGGLTWQLKRSDLPKAYNRSQLLQFVDAQTAYMLGQDGQLQKSLDGGETWIKNHTGPFTDFGFSDEKNGWARINLTDFRFLITQDGGNNWIPLMMPNRDYLNTNSMRIDATNTVTLVGDGGLITQSTDADKPFTQWKWQRRYTGVSKNLRKVYSFDGKIYWAIGDTATVLRSDDGGLTWKQVAVPGVVDFNDIQFANAQNGWIVGNQGVVLVTQDGGASWKPQQSGSKENLRKIQFVDTKTGWIVGGHGTLLATGTGGYSFND